MSGARYNSGKRRLSLVLEAQHALDGCAKVLEFGMKKYSRGNWRKGLEITEICDSLIRHMTKYLAGEDLDVGPNGEIDENYSGLPHVDHIMCNALFLADLRVTHPELDGRVRDYQNFRNAAMPVVQESGTDGPRNVISIPLNLSEEGLAEMALRVLEHTIGEPNPFQLDERKYVFDLICAKRRHSSPDLLCATGDHP